MIEGADGARIRAMADDLADSSAPRWRFSEDLGTRVDL